MSAGAVLAVLALVAVPGAGASLALLRPGNAALETRIALVVGLGYAAVALPAITLVIVHALAPAPFLALVAAVAAGLWWAALRRASARAHAAALRDGIRAGGPALWAGMAALAGIAAFRLTISPELNFSMYGPWRYWADAMEVADAGRVPDATLQWGASYVPTVSKVTLNAYHAGMSYVIGDAPLPAMGALLWLASAGLALGLWALGRELGLRRTGALLPLLAILVLDAELHRDLDVYTAENVGRMVAVCGAAAGVVALREGDRRAGLAAAVLLGAAATTHMIPAVMMLGVLACYATAVAARGRLRRAAGGVAAIAAGAVAVALTTLLLAGGDVGFEGASSGDRYAAFGDGVDPTRSLFTGEVAPLRGGDWYLPPESLVRAFSHSATTLAGSAALAAALAVAAVAAAVWLRRTAPPPLGDLGLVAVLFGACVLAGALLFSRRYGTYIPAAFGANRLYDYALLPALLVALGVLEAALGALARVRARLPALAAAAIVALAALVAVPTAAPARTGWQDDGRASVELVGWLRANTPCSARLLPNRMTLGTFAAAAGRVSVVEGMGPYLRPEMLRPVLDLVLRARSFFQDPAAHRALLAREGIDYVIAVRDVRVGSMVSVVDQGTDFESLRRQPFLRLVHRTEAADVYRVVGIRPAGKWPDPAQFAGFGCRPQDAGERVGAR